VRARFAIPAFVFTGAVLLFSLEPLVGRMLLPRFGGAFHVWTTALMFFQGALLVGYLYAHFVAERIGRFHLVTIALPIVLLPISFGRAPSTGTDGILYLLVRHVALPFCVLATTAVVAQRWWASAGKEPYRLYAVSNAGSLGALLGYALIIEPLVPLSIQRWAWMIGYVIYALIATVARQAQTARAAIERPPVRAMIYWGCLSAAPSAFLLAVTNLVALDAGSIPLVWVIPLAIYLGSFVIAFAKEDRVPRFVRRLWPHVALVGVFFGSGGELGTGWLGALVHMVVLAFVCLAANAELYRARPPASQLTSYYVVIALGGWVGGAAVALLAPVAFDGLHEYPAALAALALTMGIAQRTELAAWIKRGPKIAIAVTVLLVLVIAGKMITASIEENRTSETLAERRSFYGLYAVTRTRRPDGAVRDLVSGTTRHGRQREGDLTPLSYYHPDGPLGDVLSILDHPWTIGAVGLGVGAAAGHLQGGDRIRFFEIDPVVVELARAHFTYLEGSRGEVDVVVGDARVSLEREHDRHALLLIDAFSGDAIPTHLITVEALRLYLTKLERDGVLLLHVSNRYYNLRGVLSANARALDLHGVEIERLRGLADDEDPSQYVALARDRARLRPLLDRGWRALGREGDVWTDDHVNVLGALVID
jgi:hypothetical protein